MADIDLDDLEAKARAATPGPWFVRDEVAGPYGHAVANVAHVVIAREEVPTSDDGKDADFIAAASPGVVLELIRRMQEAEAAKERYAALNHGLRCELAEAQARERERIIHECIPGGSICDPQQIADAVRALGDA